MRTETIKPAKRNTAPKRRESPQPKPAISREVIDPAPWSSGLSLLKFTTGWAGNDLDRLLDEV